MKNGKSTKAGIPTKLWLEMARLPAGRRCPECGEPLQETVAYGQPVTDMEEGFTDRVYECPSGHVFEVEVNRLDGGSNPD